MSGEATPNLDLVYLDASQSQPEVKINDAWNKIDAAVGALSESGAGGGVIVDAQGDSPDSPVVANRIKFVNATVEYTTDGDLVTVTVSPGGSSLAVQDLDSPSKSISDVRILRFNGAIIEEDSTGAAVITIPAVEGPTGATGATGAAGATGATGATTPLSVRATWTNAFGAIPSGVADIPVYCTEAGTIRECVVLTQGGPSNLTIGVWKEALATAYPPTGANDITGGANVVISSGSTHDDSTLSGWTTSVNQGDVIQFHLAANIAFTFISITLRFG